MATISIPEKSALAILDIFVNYFKYRPGDVLQRHSLNTLWHERGLAAEDLKPGMKFAARQGWVEVIRGGASFMLTRLSGFGGMSIVNPCKIKPSILKVFTTGSYWVTSPRAVTRGGG